MINDTFALYKGFHDEIGDALAASQLTLAHAILSRQHARDEIALTVAEVAERLKVSTKKIYQMVAAGEIPHSRVGDQIRISPATLEDFIQQPSSPRRPRPHLGA